MTVEEFNKVYGFCYMICFSQAEYGYGDMILINILTGQILLTCLHCSMCDIPYMSDVPSQIMQYVEENT